VHALVQRDFEHQLDGRSGTRGIGCRVVHEIHPVMGDPLLVGIDRRTEELRQHDARRVAKVGIEEPSANRAPFVHEQSTVHRDAIARAAGSNGWIKNTNSRISSDRGSESMA
jgi:hypothetical protein